MSPGLPLRAVQQPARSRVRRRGRPPRQVTARPPAGGTAAAGPRAVLIVAGLIGLLFAVAYRQTVADEPRRSQARADLVSADQGSARRPPTTCARQADRLRDEVARERDAALGRRRGGPACATWRRRPGCAGSPATAWSVRLTDAPGRRRHRRRARPRPDLRPRPAAGHQRAVGLRRRGDRGQRPAADRDLDDPQGRRRDPGRLPAGDQPVRDPRDRPGRPRGPVRRHRPRPR